MNEPREAFVRLRVQDPLVAWLTYRAEIVSAGLVHESTVSFWLMIWLREEVTAGGRRAIYEAELALEAQRNAYHPNAVSRLRGFYAFDDPESARRAANKWSSFSASDFATVGIMPGSLVSRHDSEWITYHLGQDQSSDWMDAYLTGAPCGSEPVWELLVDGRAIVYGTELREAAYEVVKRTWPTSLPLLELSRVAVELGSDLGLIAAMLLGSPDDLRVDFVMNFADATSPKFLKRFSSYQGPRNTNDLTPESDLVPPDLRNRGFKLSI